MTIGINWDEEDARYTPAKVERSIVQENKVDATGNGTVAPSVLQDTVPASAVGQASVPPPVSTASSTGSPLPVPPPSSTPSWVNNAATSGGNALKSLGPIVDPRHYDQSGQLDQASTAAHAAADAAVGYSVLKTIQGVGSGISRRISNVIGGVDPTIQAQINQSDKQAARAASAPQGRIPNPIATPMGRIEPTMTPEPPAPPSPPAPPAPPATPVEKAALAVSEPSPLDQEKHRLAKIKADQAQFQFEQLQQKANKNVPVASIVPPEAGRTLEQTAALGKTLSPNAPVITPLPIDATPVTQNVTQTPVAKTVETPDLQKTTPITSTPVQTAPATTEITGKTGTAVSPKERAAKTTLSYKDTPKTWQKLTKEGTTFLPGYGTGDNHLFNTYGAEGRKAVLEKFNDGKPIGDYKNFELLNKKISQGVPINEVSALMARLPAEAESGNFGKLGKALKVGGIAGLGLSLSQLANAKNLPEVLLRSGDIATDYIPGIAQFKQAMTPTSTSSGTLNSQEAQSLFRTARPTGAVPPPR